MPSTAPGSSRSTRNNNNSNNNYNADGNNPRGKRLTIKQGQVTSKDMSLPVITPVER